MDEPADVKLPRSERRDVYAPIGMQGCTAGDKMIRILNVRVTRFGDRFAAGWTHSGRRVRKNGGRWNRLRYASPFACNACEGF